MIAIATGYDALDEKIAQEFKEHNIMDVKIVNYREFLLKVPFEVVIISKFLIGSIELEYLFFELRQKDVRIIYLTNEEAIEEISLCFKYSAYDVLLDPIDEQTIVETYITPKTFSDIRPLFLKVNTKEIQDKTIDISRLLEMQDKIKEQQLEKPKVRDIKIINKNQGTKTNTNSEFQNSYQPSIQKKYQDIEVVSERSIPRIETPKIETPKIQLQKIETPKIQTPRIETPKIETPKIDMTKKQEKPIQVRQQKTYEQPMQRQENIKTPSVEVKKEIIRETIREKVYEVPDDYKKIILVMSPESTGKTTIAVNMAYEFSKQGVKTILIDTDYAKKDIYFHFPNNYEGCLSRLSKDENLMKLGHDVEQNLKVFSEAKNVPVSFDRYELERLIVSSKRNSQVVIVDLSYQLDKEIIKNILEMADHILIVADQRVTTLNRIPEKLYIYKDLLQNVDLVVNRYYELKYLEEENVAKFFSNIETDSGKTFDIHIKNIFTVNDDAKAVLQALAERKPAIEIKNNFIAEDIANICSHYYTTTKTERKPKKGFGLF